MKQFTTKGAEEGQTIKLKGFGRVRILRIHAFGTIDIEKLYDGKCFRLTGLRFW